MKKLVFALTVVGMAFCVMADGASAKPRRGRPRGMSRPSGGIVEKVYNGNVLRVLNVQSAVPADTVAKLTQDIRWTSLIPVEVTVGEVPTDGCPMGAASALVAQEKVGAGVVIVDNEKLPIMVTSPDGKWAVLNVAPLKAGDVSAEKLVERFTKTYWCAVARSLGVGNSGYQGCVLAPFTNVKELDRIGVLRPCPEPFNKMIDAGAAYGIKTISIASYRTACEQGWAPPPKTEDQKAIWEQIKAERNASPSNPIKVKFDKGTEK